ncbi:MAG: copper transporter, partial [Conexibacter sp.]
RAAVHERELFERAAYPALIGGRLAGLRIALVQLGGDADRMWELTRDALEGSGAKLVSVSSLRRPLRFDELAAAAKGTRYERLADDAELVHPFGARLGIQLTEGGELLNAVRRELFVQSSGTLEGADGVVVVRSAVEVDDRDAEVAETFEDGLVRGLHARGLPVVGIETTDADPSQIDWFKAHELSSVDDVDDPIGRAALVFALAGQRGAFGVKSTADGGRLPPILQ